MTTYFAGIGGSDAAAGTSWATRKATIPGLEALALVAGDTCYVGPGTYTTALACAKSGGNAYTTGTVSVTNGSKVVTGSGTSFLANTFADGVFQLTVLAHGTDGVTNGTATFTSAAGNFQASMVGLTIRIDTKAAYIIGAVASATSITLANPDGSGPPAPTAGSGLTYDVGPESPHRITSVDSNTQLTLGTPWTGPTLTGIAFKTWQDIRFIADTTGQNTDGIGGLVRHTAGVPVTVTSFNYRTFRGFSYDSSGNNCILVTGTSTGIIIEDNALHSPQANINVGSATVTALTIRRCYCAPTRSLGFSGSSASQINSACLIENCYAINVGAADNFLFNAMGGALVRNCTLIGGARAVRTISMAAGQAVTVNNCVMAQCSSAALFTNVAGTLIEDYNALSLNASDRSNTLIGSHSSTSTYTPNPPILLANGRLEYWNPFAQLPASAIVDRSASLYPPNRSLLGTVRPQGLSSDWGAVELHPQVVTNNNAGTYEYAIPGRGYVDILIPVLTGVTYTLTAGVRWDSNASIGVKPSMTVLADHGVVETTVSATGTGGLETLTLSGITPTINAAAPGGVMILRLQNNSTHTVAINTYFSSILAA